MMTIKKIIDNLLYIHFSILKEKKYMYIYIYIYIYIYLLIFILTTIVK